MTAKAKSFTKPVLSTDFIWGVGITVLSILLMTCLPLAVLTIYKQYDFDPVTAFIIYGAIAAPSVLGGIILFIVWTNPERYRNIRGIAATILGLILMGYWPLWFLTVLCKQLFPPETAHFLYFTVGIPVTVGAIAFSAVAANLLYERTKGAPREHQ